MLATLNFDLASDQTAAQHTNPTAWQQPATEFMSDGSERDVLTSTNGGGTNDMVDAGHGNGNGARAGLNGAGHNSGSLTDPQELMIQVRGLVRLYMHIVHASMHCI